MKIVNFRPIFYCFLAFAIGIASCFYIFNANLTVIALLSVILIALIIITIKTKTFKNLIAVLIAFVVGFGFFAIDYSNFKGNSYDGKEVLVYGRVSDDVYFGENYCSVILENVKIDNVSDKNINVSISGNIDIETGYYLTFITNLYNEQPFENGKFNSLVYKSDYSYFCQINSNEIEIEYKDKNLIEKFKMSVEELLHDNMSETNASLAYSVLFGDRNNLDETVKDDFSVSGIAHLLAVSGLHIGFICSILFFALQKLKPYLKFLILALFLLFYMTLCNFSPSVVRASIMCLAFLAFGLFGKQYDFLNSVGLAGITILILWPCTVFDAGFQMSFFSVLAIGMMLKPLSKLFQKIKIPKRVAEAMAIDLSTTLAILPIMAIYYSNLSLLCWLANLICIPIFAVAYGFLFVLVFVCFVLKFLGFLLFIPQILFSFIILIADFIANIDLAVVPLFNIGIILIFAYYTIYFICGKFVMLDWKKKLVAINCVLCVGLVLSTFFYTERPITQTTFTKLNTSSMCVVIETKGQCVAISSADDIDYLKEYLSYQRLYHLDTFVLTDKETQDIQSFVQDYKVKNYFNKNFDDFSCEEYSIEFIMFNDIFKGLYFESENLSAMISVNKIGSKQLETLTQKYSTKEIDVLCEDTVGYNFSSITDFEYTFSKKKIDTENNYSTFLIGSFTFCADNAKITTTR